MHTNTLTLRGSSFDLSRVPCRRLTIEPDPSLSGTVVVMCRFKDQREFDNLVFQEGVSVKVRGKGGPAVRGGLLHDGDLVGDVQRRRPSLLGRLFGWGRVPEDNGIDKVTLEMRVLVPPRFPLAITQMGRAKVDIGDVGGGLHLDLMGAVILKAEGAGPLDLTAGGSVRARIGKVSAMAVLDLSGAVEASIGAIDVDKLSVEGSGSCEVEVGKGRMRILTANLQGSAELDVAATVEGEARLDAAGSASIRAVARGDVRKKTSGSASIAVRKV